MATFTKLVLSGSTDGRGIVVSGSATPGVLVHTGSATATVIDEVYLYLQNNHTASVVATIEYGGVTSPNDLIVATIPFKSGLYTILPGLPLKGNATPLEIRVFASVLNVISAFGFVNRITP